MSSRTRTGTRRVLRAAAVGATSLLMLTMPWATNAFGHGSTIAPESRNFGCWNRWGDNFQDPTMKQKDPMCYQAWQHDPEAMWLWNSVYREEVNGKHQQVIPDGQLCSAGRTGGTRYAVLDRPGKWHATEVSNDFTVSVNDQANHGADYYRIYVTKQGFDPTTQRLGWGDLEMVKETGVKAPGEGEQNNDPELGGVNVNIPVSAPGRTGRHIVYMIWQASHKDQTFYACSDVIFPG